MWGSQSDEARGTHHKVPARARGPRGGRALPTFQVKRGSRIQVQHIHILWGGRKQQVSNGLGEPPPKIHPEQTSLLRNP